MVVAKGHVFTPAVERFWSKVNKDGPPWNGVPCWLWTGNLTKGYGRFYLANRKIYYAHRISYEWARGPVPAGLELDHLCRVLSCVNPSHLEAVTHKENILRSPSVRATKTHCLRGHLLANARTYTRKDGRTRRSCRACVVITVATRKHWEKENAHR